MPALPGGADKREEGRFIYYPFGYGFVQWSRAFNLLLGPIPEGGDLPSRLHDEKKRNDLLADLAFSSISREFSLSILDSISSVYILLTLEQPESGFSPEVLDFFQKLLQGVPFGRERDIDLSRREAPLIQAALKSGAHLSLRSERLLIVAEPRHLESIHGTALYSLALHHRLEAIEAEQERQRWAARSYSKYTGRSTFRSLSVQETLAGEAEGIYLQSLALLELSKSFTDPKRFIPRSAQWGDKAYVLFAEAFRFEEREEIAWDGQEVLQDLFDVCWDRISEFKYFFYEAIFEIIIVVILLIDLIWLVLER